MDSIYVAILESAAALAIAVGCFKLFMTKRSASHPPGPKGEPFIGNLRQVPYSESWYKYTEWGRKYGPITFFKMIGQPVVVLNTHEAAVELLEKRAAIYSDRPRFVMGVELSGFGHGTGFIPHGPIHKQHRRLLGQALHANNVKTDFVPLQERLVLNLVNSLLETPEKFMDHLHRMTGEVVQSVAYGRSRDGDLDLVALGIESMSNVVRVMSGYLVDFFPPLKYLPEWFPGGGFQRIAREARQVGQKARFLPFQMVQRQLADGTAPPSFVRSALEARDDGQASFSDDVISGAAATLFGAGSETTAGTLLTFMLAMTLYPEVQAKARRELDEVFGLDRFPAYADKESTPYLNAVITETLRWHPVLPRGLPHRLTQDDIYDGYIIPAGTIILVNAWGILQDEKQFSNPSDFDPTRWLSSNPPTVSPWDVGFGYGRRICQGTALAESELWIVAATILSSFEIRTKVDGGTGKPIVPERTWVGVSSTFPKPFQCDILPRSARVVERIREAALTE